MHVQHARALTSHIAESTQFHLLYPKQHFQVVKRVRSVGCTKSTQALEASRVCFRAIHFRYRCYLKYIESRSAVNLANGGCLPATRLRAAQYSRPASARHTSAVALIAPSTNSNRLFANTSRATTPIRDLPAGPNRPTTSAPASRACVYEFPTRDTEGVFTDFHAPKRVFILQ